MSDGADLSFSLFSLQDFAARETIEPLVNALLAAPVGLKPTHYGYDEPEHRVESVSGIVDLVADVTSRHVGQRMGGVSLRGPNCDYQIRWAKMEVPSFSMAFGSLHRSSLQIAPTRGPAFVELVRILVPLVHAVYGEIRSAECPDAEIPIDLTIRLPNVPAISIYGPPYVELFGEKNLQRAPFRKIEQFAGQYYWLEATDKVFNAPTEDEKAAIRHHLGEDAFMSGGKRIYRSGRSPNFDFSPLLP